MTRLLGGLWHDDNGGVISVELVLIISILIFGMIPGLVALRNSGIALMTPATVHHGLAEQTHIARRAVLEAAYAATPERFVRRPPRPPALPTGAWINKPDSEEVAH